MSDIKDGGPAMMGITLRDGYLETTSQLTVRDYFAAKALQGAIHHRGFATVDVNRDTDAKDAYAYADAMLRARNA